MGTQLHHQIDLSIVFYKGELVVMWCEHTGKNEESGLQGLQFNFPIGTQMLYVTLNLTDTLKLQLFNCSEFWYQIQVD